MSGMHEALSQVIEELGFGRAQLIPMFMTGLVVFGFGCFTSMASMITVSVGTEWHLNRFEQSLLTSVFFLSTAIGGIFSGRMGDRLGRWYPIVISNAVMTVLGFLSAFSPNWVVLALFRTLTGFALGFGLPCMCAMLSEISPDKWKVPVRAFSDGCFEIGFLYTAVIATLDEPRLQHLHWRTLLMWSALPGVGGFLSFFFLKESPVFLAMTGQDAKAQKVLDGMWQANKGYHVDEDATAQELLGKMWRANDGVHSDPFEAVPSEVANDKESMSAMAEYRVVFGKTYFFITVAFCWICFCVNIDFYGGLYAQPQILGTQSETLKPGLQMVIGSFFDFGGVIGAIVISRLLSRKQSLIFGLMCCAASTWAFGWAGAKTSRSTEMELIFQFGIAGFYWIPSLLFVVLYQFVIDVFPVSVATTASGVVQASGRVGSTVGPQVFEYIKKYTGHWSNFCYAIAFASAVGALLAGFIQDPSRVHASEGSVDSEFSDEKRPLLDKRRGMSPSLGA